MLIVPLQLPTVSPAPLECVPLEGGPGAHVVFAVLAGLKKSPLPGVARNSLSQEKATSVLPKLVPVSEYAAQTPNDIGCGWMRRKTSCWMAARPESSAHPQ